MGNNAFWFQPLVLEGQESFWEWGPSQLDIVLSLH